MEINKDFYPPSLNYYVGNNSRDVIFTTTSTLYSISSNLSPWQDKKIFDNSNIFATYDPSKYGYGFLGSSHTDFHLNFEAPDTQMQSVTATPSEKTKINLRYVWVDLVNSNSNGGGSALLWSGYDSAELTPQQVLNNEVQVYKDPNYTQRYAGYGNSCSTLKPNKDTVASLNIVNYKFITELDRNKIFYVVNVQFSYIENGVKTNIDLPQDILDANIENKSPFIEYNGHKCFISDVHIKLRFRKEGSSDYGGYTQPLNSVDIASGSDKSIWGGTNNNISSDLFVVCEKIVDGRVYYYSMPILAESGNRMQNFMVNMNKERIDYVNGNKTYWTSLICPYVSNSGLSVNKGLTIEEGFNDVVNFFNFSEEFEIDTTTGFNSEKYYDVGSGYYQTVKASAGQGGQTFINTVMPYMSVDELYRLFACLLIPFKVITNTQAHLSYNVSANTGRCFVGIRDNRGYVEGDYVPYTPYVSELETELYPEDFEPFDPFNPDDGVASEDDEGDIELGDLSGLTMASAFCKQYIINNDGIDVLGSSLWGSLSQYDVSTRQNMIDNFYLLQKNNSLDYELTLSNIIDYFTSLRYYPITDLPNLSGNTTFSKYITVGTGAKAIDVADDSALKGGCYTVKNNVFQIDGGTVQIPDASSFIDLEPNVSCSVYVPFCGTVELQPSQIFGSTLSLKYGVDLTTGSMIAILMKNKSATFPIAVLQGQIGFDVPLTGNNYNTQMISASIAQQQHDIRKNQTIANGIFDTAGGLVSGDAGGVLTGIAKAAVAHITNDNLMKLQYPIMFGTSPIQVGTASSLASMLAPQYAYVQFVRHNSREISQYGSVFGKVTNKYGKIGDNYGLVICKNPKLNIDATATEKEEIKSLLSTGVFV